jgi:hypothetical protein
MKLPIDTKTQIKSLEDLGRLVGIGKKVSPEDLSNTFLRETNYDVGMQVVFAEKTEIHEETWQFEMTRGTHRVSVKMRKGGRGAWLTRPDQIPEELLKFVKADTRSQDEIISNRKWDCWMRARWARPSFRRHRSKAGTLNFSMNFTGIEKPTGETVCSILLSVFGVEDAGIDKLTLTMPFRATELKSAVDRVRMQSAQYFVSMAV